MAVFAVFAGLNSTDSLGGDAKNGTERLYVGSACEGQARVGWSQKDKMASLDHSGALTTVKAMESICL